MSTKMRKNKHCLLKIVVDVFFLLIIQNYCFKDIFDILVYITIACLVYLEF